MKKNKRLMKCGFIWPCKWEDKQGGGAILQGIGSLLAAIVAGWALWSAHDVIKEILKIQEQGAQINEGVKKLKEGSEEIKDGVKELKKLSIKIQSSIELLDGQLKELKATQIVSVLQAKNITVSEAKDAIKHIPTQPSGHSRIYLPVQKVNETVTQLIQEKTPAARAAILKNNLVIAPPEFIDTSKEE